MSRAAMCPERGDIGWLSLQPQSGREQAGRRPVLCLSPSKYNRRSGLAVFCPLTSQRKGYPFEVIVDTGGGKMGAVLADQLRSLDWKTRQFDRIGMVSTDALEEISRLSSSLIQG